MGSRILALCSVPKVGFARVDSEWVDFEREGSVRADFEWVDFEREGFARVDFEREGLPRVDFARVDFEREGSVRADSEWVDFEREGSVRADPELVDFEREGSGRADSARVGSEHRVRQRGCFDSDPLVRWPTLQDQNLVRQDLPDYDPAAGCSQVEDSVPETVQDQREAPIGTLYA